MTATMPDVDGATSVVAPRKHVGDLLSRRLRGDRPAKRSPATPHPSRFRAAGMRIGRLLAVVRPLGWIALTAGLLAFIASRLWGWQEMAVLASVLGAVFVVSALLALGRARYSVQIEMQSARVVVGQRAAGRMAVASTARRRLLPARMELPIGVAVASFAVPSLAAGETHEEEFLVPTQHRAVIPVGPARSVRGDAFGLVRRVIAWTDPQVLYIHPRTVLLDGAAAGFLKDLEGQSTKELANDDVSFHALRGYVPGDDWRYIHWKTSARTLATPAQTLMVRQFEETRRSHLAVTLSTRTDDYASDDEFELAVEVAASLSVQAFRDQRQLSVITSGALLSAITVQRVLDGFSGVEARPDADGIVAVAHATATAAPDVSVAFVVCGARPSASEIRSAARAFPIGVRVVAVRVVGGAVTSMTRIGDTAVLTVGVLEDLGRALRRAVHV